MMFEDWLTTTRELQVKSFGADPGLLQVEELEHYLMFNYVALVKELGEAFDEFDWKPWTTTHNGFVNRDAFVGEMVDVLHFVANMLVAARCSDEELSLKYKAKQQKNRDRMATPGGFTGIKAKCPMCGRNYDEPTTPCKPGKSWSSADDTGGGQQSAWCAYTHVMNDATVRDEVEEWEDTQLGTNISVDDEVRVKADAYVGRAAVLNGTIQHVATIRHGKVELRHSDGKFTLHTPDKLEVRKTRTT